MIVKCNFVQVPENIWTHNFHLQQGKSYSNVPNKQVL